MEKQISHCGRWYKWPCQKSQGDVQPCAEVCVQELFKPSVGRGLTQDCGATTRAMLSLQAHARAPDLQHPQAVLPSAPLFWESRLGVWVTSLALCWSVNFRLTCQVSRFHFTSGSTNLDSPQCAWRASGKSHLVGFSEGVGAAYFWSNWEYRKGKPCYNVSLLSTADSEKHAGMSKSNTDIIQLTKHATQH